MMQLLTVLFLAFFLSVCGGAPTAGDPIEITIPSGATFKVVVDTLENRGLVESPLLFRIYARLRDRDTQVRSGSYAIRPGTKWSIILRDLTEGRVVTVAMTIPEGFTLRQMKERFSEVTRLSQDSVATWLAQDSLHGTWSVPGPGLEGYLFPDTYHFARGVPLEEVTSAMIQRYREEWSPERLNRLAELEMDERELVTLASIIQAEARLTEEMPLISAVYHNRLRIGYMLQADPTVLYALGGPRKRLLYAAMDSVADHPYNTYTHYGLPPGPICAPGQAALDAALNPAEVDFLYFVARPAGSHIFTRTLIEHNLARTQAMEERDRLEREGRD